VSVCAATSETVTADVALDASFKEGMVNDNTEKVADCKCWQHLFFSKTNCNSQSPVSHFYSKQVKLGGLSFGDNRLSPVAYCMHVTGSKSNAIKTYSLSLQIDSSPVLGNSLCTFAALGI